MPKYSGFNTTVKSFVDQRNEDASVFETSSVLGFNLNEHVGKHPVQPHVHLMHVPVMSALRNAPPMSITVTNIPSQAAMAATANTEEVDAIGEDKQRSSYSSLSC